MAQWLSMFDHVSVILSWPCGDMRVELTLYGLVASTVLQVWFTLR